MRPKIPNFNLQGERFLSAAVSGMQRWGPLLLRNHFYNFLIILRFLCKKSMLEITHRCPFVYYVVTLSKFIIIIIIVRFFKVYLQWINSFLSAVNFTDMVWFRIKENCIPVWELIYTTCLHWERSFEDTRCSVRRKAIGWKGDHGNVELWTAWQSWCLPFGCVARRVNIAAKADSSNAETWRITMLKIVDKRKFYLLSLHRQLIYSILDFGNTYYYSITPI